MDDELVTLEIPDDYAELKRFFSHEERSKLADSGAALPDGSFPIMTRQDLKNAIRALPRAKNRARAQAHIVKRAKALGMLSLIPDTWGVKAAEQDLLTSVDDFSEFMADLFDAEDKGARRVRTPKGVRWFRQPIGSIIVPGPEDMAEEVGTTNVGGRFAVVAVGQSGNSLRLNKRFDKPRVELHEDDKNDVLSNVGVGWRDDGSEEQIAKFRIAHLVEGERPRWTEIPAVSVSGKWKGPTKEKKPKRESRLRIRNPFSRPDDGAQEERTKRGLPAFIRRKPKSTKNLEDQDRDELTDSLHDAQENFDQYWDGGQIKPGVNKSKAEAAYARLEATQDEVDARIQEVEAILKRNSRSRKRHWVEARQALRQYRKTEEAEDLRTLTDTLNRNYHGEGVRDEPDWDRASDILNGKDPYPEGILEEDWDSLDDKQRREFMSWSEDERWDYGDQRSRGHGHEEAIARAQMRRDLVEAVKTGVLPGTGDPDELKRYLNAALDERNWAEDREEWNTFEDAYDLIYPFTRPDEGPKVRMPLEPVIARGIEAAVGSEKGTEREMNVRADWEEGKADRAISNMKAARKRLREEMDQATAEGRTQRANTLADKIRDTNKAIARMEKMAKENSARLKKVQEEREKIASGVRRQNIISQITSMRNKINAVREKLTTDAQFSELRGLTREQVEDLAANSDDPRLKKIAEEALKQFGKMQELQKTLKNLEEQAKKY